MYRNARHIFLRHLTRLAIASCVRAACVDEDDLQSPWPAWEQGLMVQPAIVGSSIETRAYDYYDDNSYNINDDVPADDELKENDLGTRLDVFIAGQGSDPFWMQYHLVQGQPTVQDVTANVLNETADLLAKNYTDVTEPNCKKLVRGRKYHVYVAVNNTATNANIASKADLLALTYQNEKVHKLYGSTSSGSFDSERRMLMEGHLEWTCTSEPLQKITVPLRRAEVKVVVTVDISPAFLAQLRAETGLDTPIGTPTAASPYNGAPQWKYVNWCMDTKVFAVGDDITPTLLTDPERENMTENTTLNGQPYFYYNGKEKDEQGSLSDNTTTVVYFTDNVDDTDEYGRRYIELYPKAETLSDGHSVQLTANGVPRSRLITYTYATTWGDEAQEKAPYILISYPFYSKKTGVTEVNSSDDLVTSFNYYRIPVCDERVNSELKRNYIYKVDAIISGAGSTSFTDNETPVKLRYEVLPWTQDANETVKVKGENFHYFYVTPTTYSLRGDGTQSVNLNYYAATGDVVKFRNLQVYYYNSSGTKVYIYGSTAAERNAVFDSKSLTNNTSGQNYSVTINNDGTISVSSEALDNRAVKYISFQAYMTYVDEGGNTKTITQDVVIKHFPLDNIQNIEGSWSSKYSSYTMGEQDVAETTYDPAIGETWKNDAGYSKTEEECNSTDPYISRTDKVAGTAINYNTREIAESNQTEFQNNVTGNNTNTRNTRRRNANSEANNYNGFWGENPVLSNNSNCDFSINGATVATREQFLQNTEGNITSGWNTYNTNERRNYANSRDNANTYGKGYYGLDPVEVNEGEEYDYYTSSPTWGGMVNTYYKYTSYWHRESSNTTRYYKYSNYYKYAYYRTTYYRNKYTHTVRKMVPTVTSDWVMWDPDHTANYQNSKTTYDSFMDAKVSISGYTYIITQTQNGRNYIASAGRYYGLNNNHMYIVQISSTSDQYVLGRPIVDPSINQSSDHVVSPAFMIASQLGALSRGSTTNSADAANHCAQYMEVAKDGTRYTGWRLPTREEVSVIINYQDNKPETMATVLSDANYYALDGSYVENPNWDEHIRIPMIRCVRDLSPEEIEAINSKQ